MRRPAPPAFCIGMIIRGGIGGPVGSLLPPPQAPADPASSAGPGGPRPAPSRSCLSRSGLARFSSPGQAGAVQNGARLLATANEAVAAAALISDPMSSI